MASSGAGSAGNQDQRRAQPNWDWMHAQVSLDTQEVADERISFLLQESYAATRALLARNRPLLDTLTQRLLAQDTAPANGNGAASNGPAVWRSDGTAGTLFGAEVSAR